MHAVKLCSETRCTFPGPWQQCVGTLGLAIGVVWHRLVHNQRHNCCTCVMIYFNVSLPRLSASTESDSDTSCLLVCWQAAIVRFRTRWRRRALLPRRLIEVAHDCLLQYRRSGNRLHYSTFRGIRVNALRQGSVHRLASAWLQGSCSLFTCL